jgi:transcription initiation factor TFIIIB Brf1 subunit/transcription initiation factor TFIIB
MPFLDEAVVDCPQCFGPAEPEQDGDTALYVCTECGSVFGHTKIAQESDCQLGIPEEVRRRADVTSKPEPVMLTLGRRPE